MLKRAEQESIVRTTVIPPPGTFADLEAGLRDRYGLTEAIVIDVSEDRDGAIMARIGVLTSARARACRALPISGVRKKGGSSSV